MLAAIDHINIVVDDIQKMEHFYTKVIGLNVFKRATITGEWVDRTVGLNGVRGDVVFLREEGGPSIELIKYCTPDGERPERLTDPNTKGLRHIAFRVQRIQEAVEHCRGFGVVFLSEVQEVPTLQVPQDGEKRKRIVYFSDPEGTLLELCSYEP
jgi:catechol 2,3-dioxygenase-like lactoylglutathione lyase family enzyme